MDAPRSDSNDREGTPAQNAPSSNASLPSGLYARLEAWSRLARPALPFAASWLFLNVMVNLRYPRLEPTLWYLIPSVDVVCLFFYFAVFGWNRWRIPVWGNVALVALLFVVRLIRFGDGIQRRFYFQPFNLYVDLPLAPDLVRFAYVTFPLWKFCLVMVAALAGLVIMAIASYKALECAERYLTDMRNVTGVAIFAAAFYVVSWAIPRDPYWSELYYGGFASSIVSRIKHETTFLLNVYGYTEERTKAIADAQERLAKTPSNLSRLNHTNVYLILIESYGQATFDQPGLEEQSHATYDAFDATLAANGFSVATGLLDSSTFGGQSWLAHATLATGVRTTDQLEYEILSTEKPKTMARFFRDAGYRTVIAMPGTTRQWPKGEFYQFENKYYAWNFGYAGPEYGWATMPDQFVLDFVRRSELEEPKGPLFVQYVLVSSHAPWSDLPVLVNDWSTIRNGAIYNRLPKTHFPITWPDFEKASEPYVRSIMYDIDVLGQYIPQFIHDESLLIVLGDHQPVSEVSGDEATHGVPIHVISRNAKLLEPFAARGYVPGVRPRLDGPRAPMEEFLFDLLEDFSTTSEGAR